MGLLYLFSLINLKEALGVLSVENYDLDVKSILSVEVRLRHFG